VADFATRAQVAVDVGFRTRVGIALTRVALRQSDETQPTPLWTRKRVQLAEAVLRDPQAMANRFALVVASQDVPLTATDDELETFVRQAWDAVAGVGVEDKT
jgi:hypothetical protein